MNPVSMANPFTMSPANLRTCLLLLTTAALLIMRAAAECPNACSGHGDCGSYFSCACYRNWEGNDCSQRTCAFGLAHVDTPKGDLDGTSDSLSGPDATLLLHSQTYPYGTQERFPNMTTSGGTVMTQTAHFYMECSNKGICDRKLGECECFDGYEGAACQRASCPGDCSGHGSCEHIQTLASKDFDNVYQIWDAQMTMGCACDAGYSGPDCSLRDCKHGIDPLYTSGDQTARMEAVTYRFSRNDTDIENYRYNSYSFTGTYSLKFYDSFGEDFSTIPLAIDADCYTVEDALDGLPNTVIADDSIVCTKTSTSDQQSNLQEVEYSLTFRGNPGYLKQLFVDTYLDGDRPTVFPTGERDVPDKEIAYPTVDIFNTGMTGEFMDYFAAQCQHVYAEIVAETAGSGILSGDFLELNSGYYLDLDVMETKLLKQCLGDSDGISDDNIEVYDWDYGSALNLGGSNLMMSSYPHAIKLVQTDPYDDFQGGMYYLTWWESYNKKFILANFPTNSMVSSAKPFAVYTTDAVVERVIVDRGFENAAPGDDAEAESGDIGIGEINTGFSTQNRNKDIDPRVTAYFTAYSNILYTSYDVACETAHTAVEPCLDKGDMLFIIDSNYLTSSFEPSDASDATVHPGAYATTMPHGAPQKLYESGNIYTIEKIYKAEPTASSFVREDRYRMIIDKNLPFAGTTTSNSLTTVLYNGSQADSKNVGIVNLFKFSPATTGNYEFAAPCSGRGSCNHESGVCECYQGYTHANCDAQKSFAL